MEVCSEGHDEICHSSDYRVGCPLCKLQVETKVEIEANEATIEALREEISLLKEEHAYELKEAREARDV